MSREDVHNATAQMRGYLFQIERALFHLSKSGNNGLVGIETGDDVVVKNENEDLYEQDKSSIHGKKPFSDLSKDLWNTLSIWLEAIRDQSMELEHCSFFMVTNVLLPSTRFVFKLHQANTDADALVCVNELRTIGAKHKGKLKDLIQSVLSFSDNEIADLICRISVFDRRYNHDRNSHKKAIKSNFHISDRLPFIEVYDGLIGWLFNNICEKWDNQQQAWIKVNEVNDRLAMLVGQYQKMPFMEKAVSNLPIDSKERERERQKTFVNQLNKIGAPERVILSAIDDYLRASSERTRLARENQLTKKDFTDFEGLLMERWFQIFEREVLLMGDDDKKKVGLKIFFETVSNHREKLLGVETEQYYTTRGAYHRLSNVPKIGWHPEWEELIG